MLGQGQGQGQSQQASRKAPQGAASQAVTPIAAGAAPPVSSTPAPFSRLNCEIVENSDGSCNALIAIDEAILRRIRLRAHTQPLAEYIWNNILRPALESHVY